MITMADMMTNVGSAVAGLTVVYAMVQNHFPCELRGLLLACYEEFINFVYPYIQITFPEYPGDYGFERSKAFAAIERYLNAGNSRKQAKRLQANVLDDSEAIVFSVANNEEVTDEFKGIKLWWTSSESTPNKQSISLFPREDEKRFFKLTFYRKYREIITSEYLKHVLDEGKAITVQERSRKLYTNKKNESYGCRPSLPWGHVVFEHPATFDTLALDPDKKLEIINDLLRFSKSKEYYTKIGRAWKRGYLLYGPPGTGKSTMIAAMANLLKYDVYDLELTAIEDNTELRKLLINTSSKSIIVIEDIDCSLDLTGQRQKKRASKEEEEEEENDKKKDEGTDPDKTSQVTLSGLLNTIDGLWSACAAERIIVFATNYVEKLDPALIRRGRMDKHIELSYCSFEAFKILAKNYLDIDSHDLFATIRRLLEETNITPADVAHNLMLKSGSEDVESNLMRLMKALEEAKEKARRKAEEEEKQKAEKLAKEEEEKKAKEKENGGEHPSMAGGVKENGARNSG